MMVEDICGRDTSRLRGALPAWVIRQVSSGGSGAQHILWVHRLYPTSVGLHQRPPGATRVREPLLGAGDEKKGPADSKGAQDA